MAIKWFEGTPDLYITREAETLKKCNHKNVVKFLGLESVEKVIVERQVLAMEFCSGGNLQEMIDSNPNGLSSTEFFRVCEDLVSAIKYLHKMKLVHRDIKPGNIVISKCCDGKSIYKVADFGAARTLRPNQHYSSLYGTYEYVHPDIFVNFYRQALDITPTVKVFNETHEMWSVGVTLFETATGKLPFNPKSGREDCKTMYKMTSAKQHGQISATEGKDGIEWSRELPQSCMIEQKDNVTRFLAGLLEVRSFYFLFDL